MSRVFVDSPHLIERLIVPDVRVVERGRGPAAAREQAGAVAVAEPLVLKLDDEPVSETFIEIIDVGSGRRVVTVLEVLSLANKRPGDGQDLYLKKQRELLGGKVSLVEIDLLRAGQSVLSVAPRRIPRSHRTPYRILVRRGWQPWQAELYAIPLPARLPAIRVPLRETDADVLLDLQPLLDRCYDNGGYQDDRDYEAEPEPAAGGGRRGLGGRPAPGAGTPPPCRLLPRPGGRREKETLVRKDGQTMGFMNHNQVGASNPVLLAELAPPDYRDPVIEAYKKDVDRTLLRENLKLSVAERHKSSSIHGRYVSELRAAGEKARKGS